MTDQQWDTLAASRGPGVGAACQHSSSMCGRCRLLWMEARLGWRIDAAGQHEHDRYFRRGIEIGASRERSRLVGNLRRAYREGRDAGWLSVLLVWCALVVWGSLWGRR